MILISFLDSWVSCGHKVVFRAHAIAILWPQLSFLFDHVMSVMSVRICLSIVGLKQWPDASLHQYKLMRYHYESLNVNYDCMKVNLFNKETME